MADSDKREDALQPVFYAYRTQSTSGAGVIPGTYDIVFYPVWYRNTQYWVDPRRTRTAWSPVQREREGGK